MKIKQNSGQKLISNRSLLLTSLTLLLVLGAHLQSWGNGQNGETFYVGSSACRDCHPEEYENFITYAKKSTSFQSIEKQMKHLTPDEIKQCYPCHTQVMGKLGDLSALKKPLT